MSHVKLLVFNIWIFLSVKLEKSFQGALVVFQLGNSNVVHRKSFLFETFCCSWHVLFQRAPDQKQNRKIVITGTDQVTQYIIRKYEA